MSFVEKLLIRSTVNSENFLKNFFIGIGLYSACLLVLFVIAVLVPNKVTSFLLYGHTTFIIIHSLFLFPSLFNLMTAHRRSGPIWERAISVFLVNIALIVTGITFSSYIYHS